MASVDPTGALSEAISFNDCIGGKFTTRRLGTLLVSLFSGVALFLSAIGLYGVLAYFVTQRNREIGVRIAVGARPGNIVGLVMSQGLKIVALGLAIGLSTALLAGQFINSLLYGVTGTDPIAVSLAILVLFLAALLACCLPALRAARTNPITALHQ
ncbi:MAG: FtsX-like permease family protein [Verrucomicrobia bacterium]|nr:FtsX-like permease family protein [Verrucomicrobiota bacterium]